MRLLKELVTEPFIIGIVLITVGALAYSVRGKSRINPTSPQEYASTTAMITNLAANSGGTGVVLESNNTESLVLTNAHVCEVVEQGGLVITDTKKASVVSYKVSEQHDLCLVKVKADLGINTIVAKRAPESFSKATIAGHPRLLPTIITEGHFSHKMMVEVLAKIKKCEEKDFEGDNAIFCVFMGGIPVIKLYEAQPVSATIQPGSSGSAVFNKDGEIAGLVFAGAGQLSYGFIVPQEYVYYFVNVEEKYLTENIPNTETGLNATQMKKKLKTSCIDGSVPTKIQAYCKYLEQDTSILAE